MQEKKLWLVALAALCAVNTHAQNTFPVSGNVGIGTTAPNVTLEVNGATTVDTTGGGGNGLVWYLNSGHNGLMPALRSGSGGSGSPGQIESTYLVLNGESGGNVGIGTTQPQTMLHVTAPASNSLVWAGILQNPGNYGANTGVGVGLQFKASAYIGDNLTETNKWSGIAGFPDVGSSSEDHFGLVFYTHNGVAVTPNEVMRIASTGNVGIGTTTPGAPLEVNGSVKLTSGSGASMTFQDGSVQSVAWTGSLCGGDYAEAVNASGDHKKYEPGDVLVLSDDNGSDVSKSTQPYSTLVTGIYSTKPGVIGRRQEGVKSDSEIPMAMVGIVPTKVSAENGSIKRGDLLVSSSTEGYAMKGTDRGRMLGAVVGKALGSLDSRLGVIEVIVSLQ